MHNGGDYGILNYEYEQVTENTLGNEFKSDPTHEYEHEVDEPIEKLVSIQNEPDKMAGSSDKEQMMEEKLSLV